MDDESAKRERRAQEDRDFTSNRISDLSRYVAFGVLGAVFVLLSTAGPVGQSMLGQERILTAAVIILAIAAVFSDYFQYLSGYYCSRKLSGDVGCQYEKSWTSYRTRQMFFWLKQVLAGCAGLLFVILMVTIVISKTPHFG